LVWTGLTPPQHLSENTHSFELGCTSVSVEFYTRCAEALKESLNCTTPSLESKK